MTHPAVSMPSFNVALIGNPNVGKTTIFNALTGLRHNTANYPGVTVEKRWGSLKLRNTAEAVELIDLPGAYSLNPQSPDEEVVRNVLFGKLEGTKKPDLVVMVMDANNFNRNLYLALQVMAVGLPMILVLNMWDEAMQSGKQINLQKIQEELGLVAIPTEGSLGVGIESLRSAIEESLKNKAKPQFPHDVSALSTVERYQLVDRISARVVKEPDQEIRTLSHKIDDVLTHPFLGWLVFGAVMGVIFQSIFSWATPLMDLISQGVESLGQLAAAYLPAGPLESLVVDGMIAGVGNVIVFVPQIFLLFFFIAFFEDFGYMARAAFVLDRIMKKVGLNGKAFLPLLSSFACAIPGIMATRTIPDKNDRLATILVAPLMSCSARLPVYALMIAAFIPEHRIFGIFSSKGITLFAMYFLSIFSGLGIATLFKKTLLKGTKSPFLLELPPYRVPRLQNVLLVMWDRGKEFIRNAGTTIFMLSIILWFLVSYPKSDVIHVKYQEMSRQAAAQSLQAGTLSESQLNKFKHEEASEQLQFSFAGRLGRVIEPVIRPLGFDWKIGIGLVSSFAAREVLVSTLAIIYNVGNDSNESSTDLISALRNAKDPVTGKAVYTPLIAVGIMVFFVLACQCLSTVAIVRRETGGWSWPLFMITYMTILAWAGAFLVHQGGLLYFAMLDKFALH